MVMLQVVEVADVVGWGGGRLNYLWFARGKG